MRFVNIIILFLLGGTVSAQKVEWYVTTQTSPWVKQKIKSERTTIGEEIVLDPTQRLQLITGIGGCFNEMGWDALNALSTGDREAVLQAIFGKEGACFDYCRLPMGANDFAMSFYSSADIAEDFNLVNFNIDRDRYILIPYIKAARQVNPDLRIWASPWCPPVWMKTNNHYASAVRPSGEADVNGLLPGETIAEFSTGFRMEEGYLKTYADYFARFIKAYEAEGLPLECIHVQNEPCSNQVFPSCKWRSEDLAFFISDYLGPKFEEDGIKTDIYFGTVNTSIADYVRTALNNEKAAKYIKGVGFQWSGKKAIPIISKEYPHLKYVQTESECGNGANIWSQAEYTWSLMHQYLTNGASVYAYWNLILDQTGVSPWGWRQNSLITIDKETKEVKYNPEYYIMKHISKYVLPGAYRLITNERTDHLAFQNPDGQIVVVIVNQEETDKEMNIGYKDKMISLKVKAKSFNTIKF